MLFNMILPAAQEVETVISRAEATPMSATALRFADMTKVPNFYAIMQIPNNDAAGSQPIAWIINDSICSFVADQSTTNITSVYDSAGASAYILSGGMNVALTYVNGFITSSTYQMFYTDGEVKSKSATILTGNTTINFSGVGQSETEKLLLLVQTASSAQAAGRPAYYVRMGESSWQARGYTASYATTTFIRTVATHSTITEIFSGSTLTFARDTAFPIGTYTIYYA